MAVGPDWCEQFGTTRDDTIEAPRRVRSSLLTHAVRKHALAAVATLAAGGKVTAQVRLVLVRRVLGLG